MKRHSQSLFKAIKISKIISLILLSTMIVSILASCSQNRFTLPAVSETEKPSFEDGIYPKIATIDNDPKDYTVDNIDKLARYTLLVVPASVLKDSPDIISKIKQKNSNMKILMYQMSLNDAGRAASSENGTIKAEESWYYHKAPTSASQSLEQRRVLIQGNPVINLGGELAKQMISKMKSDYSGLKNVDGIYFDRFNVMFNARTEFTADINGDGKDEDYITIIKEYSQAITDILAEARTLAGDTGSVIVNSNTWDPEDPLIKGKFTGITDRNGALGMVNHEGNSVSAFAQIISMVDSTDKDGLINIFQEDIGAGVKPDSSGKITIDALSDKDRQTMRLGLCISLMGESYFMAGIKNSLLWFPEYDAGIGKPKDVYKKLDNSLYSREFENATIIINPNPGPVDYTFSSPHTDVTSGEKKTAFTLQGKDARIFLNH